MSPDRAAPAQPRVSDVSVGDELPVMTKNASRAQLFLYSAASFNPHRIHYDREYAAVEGHADVLVHALCDAIIGAMASGDIGHHFPDTDDSLKDISSLVLLDKVMADAASRGLSLVNGDITLVCQAPRLAPSIVPMREKLAEHCRCSVEQINIKATTTETMGYTGRQEGISCHAVVLLQQH